MIVIAHAGHYIFGLFEVFPVLIVVAVALWNTLAGRSQRRSEGDVTPQRHGDVGATGPHA